MASVWTLVVRKDDGFYVEEDVGSHVSHNFLVDTGTEISLIHFDEKLAKFTTGKIIIFSGVTGTESKAIQLPMPFTIGPISVVSRGECYNIHGLSRF